MIRPAFGLALLGLVLASASCRSGPSDEQFAKWEQGSGIQRKLTGYHTIVSARKGKVGFLKAYDVTEFKGAPYPWKYVYDLDHRELGMVDQFGNAYRYHYYSPAEQVFQNETLRADVLPADSIQNNVMRMLGLDVYLDSLTFPKSTQEDITGDSGAAHLAGPGVVPAKAPVTPEKPGQ